MNHVLTELVLGVVAVVCLVLGILVTWESAVDSRDSLLQDPSVRVTWYDWSLGLVPLGLGVLAAYCFLAGL